MKRGVIKERTFQSGQYFIEPDDTRSVSHYEIAEESKHLINGNLYRNVDFTVNKDGYAVIKSFPPESKL